MLTHEKIDNVMTRFKQKGINLTVEDLVEVVQLLDEAHDVLIEQHAKLSEIQKMTRMYDNDGNTPCEYPDEGPNW